MSHSLLLFLHVLSIATLVGGSVSQLQLMREAGKGGDDARNFLIAVRSLQRKVELPAMLATVFFGVVMLVLETSFLKLGWMHAKLGLVVVLLGILHWQGRKVRRVQEVFRDEGPQNGALAASSYANGFALGTLFLTALVIFLAVARPF